MIIIHNTINFCNIFHFIVHLNVQLFCVVIYHLISAFETKVIIYHFMWFNVSLDYDFF